MIANVISVDDVVWRNNKREIAKITNTARTPAPNDTATAYKGFVGFGFASHNSTPQCGQVASSIGRDGSTQTALPQTGQRDGQPSGVRVEIVIAAPDLRRLAFAYLRALGKTFTSASPA
jgi:hypothetical protein